MRTMFVTLCCLGTLRLASATRYNLGSKSLATSTCSAHFNTPCAIRTTHTVVYDVAAALLSSNSSEVLANVSSGAHNVAFNFWPSIFDENGTYVACGRPAAAKVGEPLPSGSELVGRPLEVVAAEESGQSQAGLWTRIVAAAAADGYFDHTSADLYPGHARDFHPAAKDVVSRVGFVRRVEAGGLGALYVVSSFTDAPFADATARQTCDWRFDAPCSISYTRRVLGRVTTRLLRASSAAALQRALYEVSSRAFNEQLRQGDAGFYPFVYEAASATCVAHGANPGFVGRTLPGIIAGAASLVDLVNGSALHGWFVDAAGDGGGWVGYHWRNGVDEAPYLKTAFIAGLTRFGVAYYIGVGYNHEQAPRARGPHCAPCRQDYNYPCAWANTEALIGHAQSLLFMTNRQPDVADAFAILTADPGYGGGGTAGRASAASADWLYTFAYDFNGTSVAHGAAGRFVGRTLWDIIGGSATLSVLVDGRQLHERFVAAARNGGGWVSYAWKNTASECVGGWRG
jgi:hypothetical protein